MQVIATAGHVDHGKSTLVQALTGIDPDRFEEEKRRGLTIDLGFAWATLPSGEEIAFVDVPGHVRFLKNMIAGVGAVDACLFVVAATEGWKPQSEEHLRILELLGLRRGVVALTKTALVDDDVLELAQLEIAEKVEGTFLAGAPVVETDAPTGAGLDGLRKALDSLVGGDRGAEQGESGRPRLWIDRVFPMRGAGTVVTGTLAGGSLAVGEALAVVPGPPPSLRPLEVKVRGLQRHRSSVQTAGPGRLAVNLTGASHDQLVRGQALVKTAQWEPSRRVDASLAVLSSLDHEVSRRGAYRAYFGSGQHAVRLSLIGASSLLPGEGGLVRLFLPRPVPLIPGDRYVLREVGRSETVGGGEVLDVDPVLPVSRARPDRSVERVVAERRIVEAAVLERLTGVRVPPSLADRYVVDEGARAELESRLGALVHEAGPLGLELSRLGEVERAVLSEMSSVVLRGGRAVSAANSRADVLSSHPFVEALDASPFSPPSPSELQVSRDELRELVRQKRVVESDGLYFSPRAVAEAARRLSSMLGESPDGVTASAIRETLGTSRKYALPLLGHLDSQGVTRRRGDVRIAGPRLAEVAAGPELSSGHGSAARGQDEQL